MIINNAKNSVDYNNSSNYNFNLFVNLTIFIGHFDKFVNNE